MTPRERAEKAIRCHCPHDWSLRDMIVTQICEAVAEEREACAKVAETQHACTCGLTDDCPGCVANDAGAGIANAIRKRET